MNGLSYMRCASYAAGCRESRPFPPKDLDVFHTATLREILEERASRSLNRVCPRDVKRKMSNYPLRPRTRTKTVRIDFRAGILVIK